MVTLPRQRVREVHLKCRFCAFHHFNTRNKGTVYIPGQIFGKDDPLSLPQTCQNIPHFARPAYGKNLSKDILAQLRREAWKTAYEIGALSPERHFEYQSSDSESSCYSDQMD